MTANPFAALLDGVPYYIDDGEWCLKSDVLAALAAAVPDDLAEAGKVLEGVTPEPWVSETLMHDDPNGDEWPTDVEVFSQSGKHIHGHDLGYNDDTDAEIIANARFIAWCREGVPALLARIAAQEAQMKADGERAAELMIQHMRRTEAAETALAAERAKVARLVESLGNIAKQKKTTELETEYDVECADFEGGYDAIIEVSRAAITEATQ